MRININGVGGFGNVNGMNNFDFMLDICRKNQCETCVAVNGKPVRGPTNNEEFMCLTGMNRGVDNGHTNREET